MLFCFWYEKLYLFINISLKSLREIEITKVKVARIWMQDEKFHLFLSLSWGLFP